MKGKNKITAFSYFSNTHTVIIGATGIVSRKWDLPGEYDHIVGVAVRVIDLTNQTNFNVGFADNSGVLVDKTHHSIVKYDDSVPPDHKFLKTFFPYNSNDSFKTQIEMVDGAVAGTDLVFQVILKLAKIENSTAVKTSNEIDFETGVESQEKDYATPN